MNHATVRAEMGAARIPLHLAFRSCLLSLLLALPGRSADPGPREEDFIARNVPVQSGEVLPELKLHYTTLGSPQRGPDGRVSNAVLLLHGTTGTGRNLFWRRILSESIRTDPDWKGGEYSTQPTCWTSVAPLFTLMTDSPVRLQAQAPTRAEAGAAYDRVRAAARKNYDANDYLYWLESSWDYDPEPGLGAIRAPLLAVNFADDLINPPELGIMEKLIGRVAKGRAALIPRSEATVGHQTLALAAVWKPYLVQLLQMK